jgi:hypothetical protein
MTAALKSACSSEDKVNFNGGLLADMSIDENRAIFAGVNGDSCPAEPPLIPAFLAGTSMLLFV